VAMARGIFTGQIFCAPPGPMT